MKILLILIMAMGAIMIITYFAALITHSNKVLIAFRVIMLLLIFLLLIGWIISLILGQHQILLLVLAVVFILLYIFS